jgi:hypothetical protein
MHKTYPAVLFSFLLILLCSCKGHKNSGAFPMKKKYWSPEDYHKVNNELTSLKYNEEELPRLDDPETEPVFKKIADTTNFSIVANDENLGIKHRSQFTSKMFDQYKELLSMYSDIDRQDKYEYPVEFVELLKFGLSLQAYYIKTTNENNLKAADDPQAAEIVSLIKRNEDVLISNYDLYLDYINYEDRFNDKALTSYSEGLGEFFPRLINNLVPAGYYNDMLTKVENMLKKSKNKLIITQLKNIQGLIKNKISTPAD